MGGFVGVFPMGVCSFRVLLKHCLMMAFFIELNSLRGIILGLRKHRSLYCILNFYTSIYTINKLKIYIPKSSRDGDKSEFKVPGAKDARYREY